MYRPTLILVACSMLPGGPLFAGPDSDELEQYTERPLRGVSIGRLAWQAGLWRSDDHENASWQFVSCPTGGMQLGVQQDLKEGETRFFEFQRYAEVDGGIVFFAQPLGREATPFVLVELGPTRAVFENRMHDYPQRIALERQGEELVVRIEGDTPGKSDSSAWSWRAVPGSAACVVATSG